MNTAVMTNTTDQQDNPQPSRIEITITETRKLRAALDMEIGKIEELLRNVRGEKAEPQAEEQPVEIAEADAPATAVSE